MFSSLQEKLKVAVKTIESEAEASITDRFEPALSEHVRFCGICFEKCACVCACLSSRVRVLVRCVRVPVCVCVCVCVRARPRVEMRACENPMLLARPLVLFRVLWPFLLGEPCVPTCRKSNGGNGRVSACRPDDCCSSEFVMLDFPLLLLRREISHFVFLSKSEALSCCFLSLSTFSAAPQISFEIPGNELTAQEKNSSPHTLCFQFHVPA